MLKYRVSLKLDKKSVADRIVFGTHVHSNMVGNGNFGAPLPSLGSLQTATDELATAKDAAIDGSVLSTTILTVKTEAFDLIMTAMGNYVDSVAMGSKEIIESAGMTATSKAGPLPFPVQVEGLVALPGLSGSAQLQMSSKQPPEEIPGAVFFAILIEK